MNYQGQLFKPKGNRAFGQHALSDPADYQRTRAIYGLVNGADPE